MGRISKLREIEQSRGKPIRDVLCEEYARQPSQAHVAAALGVSQATISTWIASSRLRPKVILMPCEEGGDQTA